MIKLIFKIGETEMTKEFQLAETAKTFVEESVPDGTEIEIIVLNRGDHTRNTRESDRKAVLRAIDCFYGGYGANDD